MNVAIAGAGIAGGYLAGLLEQRGISPDVYDGWDHATSCQCRSCGWGVPIGIKTYLTDVGLDLNDYLIEPMSPMNFDGLAAETSLCTVHKPRLLRDFTSASRLKRQNLGPGKAEDYDIVVDATGVTRALLPPCSSDLTLPTLQHRVAVESNGNERLEAGVYGNRIPGPGYLWIFPLGTGHYHIGIGGTGLIQHDSLLERFFRDSSERFSFTIQCSCRGSIRVASPHYSTPFYLRKTRNDGTPQLVIGVGESIGTVSPFTGEGIVHSLECARMLADSWPNPEDYTKAVLARFVWMKKERETLDYLLSPEGKSGPRLRDRWRFFCNARRSGIELPVMEAFRRTGSLSPWVENPDIL
jgi:flavin-dependent dehydrogenase